MGSLIFGAGKKAPRAKEPIFLRVLNALQTPLFITAGLVREEQRRAQGRRPEDRATIIKESAANLLPFLSETKRRTTYHDVVDDSRIAFALDIFGDPLTYVPTAAFLKVGKGIKFLGKAGIKTPGMAALKHVDNQFGTKTFDLVMDVRDKLGKAFEPFYELRTLGGKKLVSKGHRFLMDLENLPREIGEQYEKELMRITPNMAERMHIVDLVERRPVFGAGKRARIEDLANAEKHKEFLDWQKEVVALSPEARAGYKYTVAIRKMFEEIKLEAGLLTAEHMAGFIKKFGINYVPHFRAKKQYFLDQGKDFLKALEKGDPHATLIAKTWKGGDAVKDIKAWMREVDRSIEIITPADMEAIKRGIPFMHPRKISGTAKQVAAANLEDIELDMAKLLGVEGAQLGRALASQRYIQEMVRYMRSKNMLFGEEVVKNRGELTKEILKRFGVKGKDQFRRGLVSLDDLGIKELAGQYVPKEIADEIMRVTQAYKNPQFMRDFLTKYKEVQDIWKAWTLSLFPAYHSRNAISNLWNNFLAGMGPESIPHYKAAHELLWKRHMGTLNFEEAKIIEEALHHRVLQGGQFEGEIGHLFQRLFGKNNMGSKLMNPAENPAIQFGYKTGRAIENHARLAHFLWAKNHKGMSAWDAASSVNKFLFDYKYGLTPFEKKAFRNFLAPFYAWTRFNVPLQLEMLALKPGRFAILPKSIRSATDLGQDGWGNPDEDQLFMADWMKRALKVRLRYNKDKEAYEYFILDSWIPSADVGKILSMQGMRDMVSGMLSPFTKVPIEVFFNYNLFQKRKIREYGLPLTKTGQKKKLLGVPLWPEVEHAARSIRIFNEADKFIDAFFTDTGQTSRLAAITGLLVGKIYPVRPAQQQKWWVYQSNRRIQELKRIRKFADKNNDMGAVEKLDKLIGEAETERDYFQKLKVDNQGVREG